MISEAVAGRRVVADGGDVPETDVADDVPESSGVQVTSFCGSMTPPAWLM